MEQYTNKLVAVLNEKREPGKIMNALAHMTLGFGAQYEPKHELRFTNYVDGDGGNHKNISEMPFMILKANSNKIRNLRKECITNNIPFTDFTHSMTEGSFQEQLQKTKEMKEEELDYYGIVLCGEWVQVSEMTKKFSLWR